VLVTLSDRHHLDGFDGVVALCDMPMTLVRPKKVYTCVVIHRYTVKKDQPL
jgi:hypothetical protein